MEVCVCLEAAGKCQIDFNIHAQKLYAHVNAKYKHSTYFGYEHDNGNYIPNAEVEQILIDQGKN